jgi:putative peptide zinc metalloprotease protein
MVAGERPLSPVTDWIAKLAMITSDARLAVFPFTRQIDGDEIIIGRVDTGVYLALPPDAVEILDHLAGGKTVSEVEEVYRQQYGETTELEEFLITMEEKGFLLPIPCDGAILPPQELRSLFAARSLLGKRRYHFTNFPQATARRVFSRGVLITSGVLIALALIVIILNPSVVPGWSALYFPTHRTLFAWLTTVFGLTTLFMHEMAHLVAARACGVESRMGISHRLWILVAETDLSGLWSVPRRERYLPFLAGAIFDAVCASILILLVAMKEFYIFALSPALLRLVNAAIFTLLLRLLWQCFFFVRTDFYYAISTFLNCKNLMADTEIFLRNKAAAIFRGIRPVDQSHIPHNEMRVIRGYSVVWIIGRLLAFSSLLFVTIPLGVKYCRALFVTLTDGYARNHYSYLDALALSGFSLVTILAGASLWIVSLAKRWRKSP